MSGGRPRTPLSVRWWAKVDREVNILRGEGLAAQNLVKTHCPEGHAYDDENTYVLDGRRHCRTCSRARTRRWRRANPDYRRRAIAA